MTTSASYALSNYINARELMLPLRNSFSLVTLLLRGLLVASFSISVEAWSSSSSGSHSGINQQHLFTGQTPSDVYDTTIELLWHYTNDKRCHFRLNQLRFDNELSKAAQRHAACMAKNGYFSHTGYTGSCLGDRVKMTKYRYTSIGENLFMQRPRNSPTAAVEGWMTSRGHRENLLNPEFSEVGLGYCSAGETHYYVQVLGKPIGSPAVHGEDETREIMFLITNQARKNANLCFLSLSVELNVAAQQHAERIARRGSFSSDEDILCPEKYQYSVFAAHFFQSESFNDPYGVIEGWLKMTDSHLLKGQFTDMGVGYAESGKRHYYVQLFGTPSREELAEGVYY